MARKVIETILDDIDGSEGAETVSFGLDGKQYEIDLGEANRKALNDALAPYIKAARSTGGARRTSASRRNSDTAAIRAWAAENGIDVPSRGRIPASVVEQYQASNK